MDHLVVQAQAGDHRQAQVLVAARVAVAGRQQGTGDAVGAVGRAGEAGDQRVLGHGANQSVEAVLRRRRRLQGIRLPFTGIGAVAGREAGLLPRLLQAGEGELQRRRRGQHLDPCGTELADQEAGDAVAQGVAGGEHHGVAALPGGLLDPARHTGQRAVHVQQSDARRVRRDQFQGAAGADDAGGGFDAPARRGAEAVPAIVEEADDAADGGGGFKHGWPP